MSHMLLVVFTQRWDKHTHAHTHADARKEQKKNIIFVEISHFSVEEGEVAMNRRKI